MSIGFIVVDIGNPFRFWHMLPGIGTMNFPSSMLSWDFFVLLTYLTINLVVVTHLLHRIFIKKDYNKKLVLTLVFISIPMAVAIHTVTAFLYNAIPARPFWNSALLAPRFLASAFCSGPAILLILFQLLRKFTHFEIKDEAIWTIAELMVYAMFIYLFFSVAELFKEFYSGTEHLLYWQYLLFGIGDNKELVPYSWASIIMGCIAFVLFLIPKTRKNFTTLNIGAVLIYASVYVITSYSIHYTKLYEFAIAQTRRRSRTINIIETEWFSRLWIVVASFNSKRDHIIRVYAVLRIIQRKLANPRMVSMC